MVDIEGLSVYPQSVVPKKPQAELVRPQLQFHDGFRLFTICLTLLKAFMYCNETMYCNFTIYLFHHGCSIGNGIFSIVPYLCKRLPERKPTLTCQRWMSQVSSTVAKMTAVTMATATAANAFVAWHWGVSREFPGKNRGVTLWFCQNSYGKIHHV